MKSILLDEKLLGLAEMTSGPVNVRFSLPEWQAIKMIFFVPCSRTDPSSFVLLIYGLVAYTLHEVVCYIVEKPKKENVYLCKFMSR